MPKTDPSRANVPAAAIDEANADTTAAASSCSVICMSLVPTMMVKASTTATFVTAMAAPACANWLRRSPRPMTMVPTMPPRKV